MFIRKKTYDDIMQRLSSLESRLRPDPDGDWERSRRRIQDLENQLAEFDKLVDYWVSDLRDGSFELHKRVRELEHAKKRPGFFRKAAGFVSNLHWHSPGIGPRR